MVRSREIETNIIIMFSATVILLGIIAVSMLTENREILAVACAIAILLPLVYLLVFRLNILVFIMLFAVPLSVKMKLPGGIDISFPAEILAGLVSIIYILNRTLQSGRSESRVLHHPVTVLVLLDILWLAFTALFSEMPIISLKRVLARIIFAVVFYFILTGLFSKIKNIALFWILYAAGLLVPVLSTLYNHSRFDFSKSVSNMMTGPFYNDHTQYATCIAFVLPVLVILSFLPDKYGLKKSFRYMGILLLIVLTAGEVFSFSRAAWLSIGIAFLMACLVIILRFRLIHFMILTVVSGIIIYINLDDIQQYAEKVNSESRSVDVGEHLRSVLNIQTDPSNLERINRWHCAIEMFRDRPLTGFGPGTYQFIYGKYQLTPEMTGISTKHGEKGNAHSEYLTYLSEAGFPGFIIFNLLILSGFSTAIRIFRKSSRKETRWLGIAILMGFIAYFFHGLFNSFFETDKAAALAYGSLASLVALEVYHGSDTIKPVRSGQDLTG